MSGQVFGWIRLRVSPDGKVSVRPEWLAQMVLRHLGIRPIATRTVETHCRYREDCQ